MKVIVDFAACLKIKEIVICLWRLTVYRNSNIPLSAPRCSSRGTTAQELFASSRTSSPRNSNPGYVLGRWSCVQSFRTESILTCFCCSLAGQATFRGDHPDFKQPVCWSRETRGEILPRGLPGLPHCLHHIPLYGDPVWKGKFGSFWGEGEIIDRAPASHPSHWSGPRDCFKYLP